MRIRISGRDGRLLRVLTLADVNVPLPYRTATEQSRLRSPPSSAGSIVIAIPGAESCGGPIVRALQSDAARTCNANGARDFPGRPSLPG